MGGCTSVEAVLALFQRMERMGVGKVEKSEERGGERHTFTLTAADGEP